MDAHSLILLEFSRIREELAGYCLCADSVERLAGLGFAKTEAELAPPPAEPAEGEAAAVEAQSQA